jgi:GNAT superfamily N-acetyltransferase
MEQHFARWCLPRLECEEYIGQFACDGEQVIAGAGLWLIDWPPPASGYGGPRGYLLNVFVEPAYRGKGIATQCVVSLIDECRARKIENVRLHASVLGRPLYEKLGFVQTNEMGMLLN